MSQELVAEINSLTKRLRALEEELKTERELRLYREATAAYLTEDNSDTESDVELVAKNLFDALPHRHPNGNIPRWDQQPQRLRENFVRAAEYSVGLSEKVPAMLSVLQRLDRVW